MFPRRSAETVPCGPPTTPRARKAPAFQRLARKQSEHAPEPLHGGPFQSPAPWGVALRSLTLPRRSIDPFGKISPPRLLPIQANCRVTRLAAQLRRFYPTAKPTWRAGCYTGFARPNSLGFPASRVFSPPAPPPIFIGASFLVASCSPPSVSGRFDRVSRLRSVGLQTAGRFTP